MVLISLSGQNYVQNYTWVVFDAVRSDSIRTNWILCVLSLIARHLSQDRCWVLLHDLTLPGSIRISNQLDYRAAIADVLNSWKDLLNVLPKDDILSIHIIDLNVFDISCCASNTKRLGLFHCLVWMAVSERGYGDRRE